MTKTKDHSCKENMMLDGDCQIMHLVFNDAMEVLIPGQCSLCTKRLVEKYKYVDTRDAETGGITF